MANKPVLGKGLASLLSNAAPAHSAGTTMVMPPAPPAGATAAGEATTVAQQEYRNKDRHPGISLAALEEILDNPYQPRRDFDETALEELAQSIRANGIIQPLVVRKTAEGYQLIAGERRLRAAKLAGLKQVPIVIRKSTDREALEIALVENIQRQNLNCIDEALAYFQLMQDFSLTQEEVAERVGKERTTVANHLRLLRLPEAIIDDLKRQILSFGHGKAILSADDTDIRLRARAIIVEKRLSVRDSEALIEDLKRQSAAGVTSPAGTPVAVPPPSPLQSRLQALAQSLTRQWTARVEIKGSERKGKVVLHYGSRQELDRILLAMQNKEV